jgi:hypothetical protein
MLIEDLTRYTLGQREETECDCEIVKYPYGEYVKFSDIKDNAPSTDVQQLKSAIGLIATDIANGHTDLTSVWARLLRLSQTN